MIKKIYVLVLVLSITKVFPSHDVYPKFNVCKADIDAVLNSAVTTPVDNTLGLPADISFVCADVKYDGSLKFCECGDSIYMSFRTAEVELNGHKQHVVSPYWGIFWHYLKKFKLPIWHVGATGPTNSMAMEELDKVGGRHVAMLQDLTRDPLFKRLSSQNFKKTNSISKHKGIIVYRAKTEYTRDCYVLTKFQQDYPQFLFVNATARNHVKRKDNTYKLFSAAHLDDYIPRFNVYPAVYTPTLAQQINEHFGKELLIVKPVFSSLSNGVNAVTSNNLDSLLKLILQDKKDIAPDAHRSLNHWRKSHAPVFFASEYAQSKTIYKDNKPYDPTMRIVFMMHHDNNTITTIPIAGFWKIPVKSLADDVSTTDQRITIAHAGSYYSGILADSQDWTNIKNTLHTILPQLYVTMLAQAE